MGTDETNEAGETKTAEAPLCRNCNHKLQRCTRNAWMRWIPDSIYFRCPDCRSYHFLALGRLYGPWNKR